MIKPISKTTQNKIVKNLKDIQSSQNMELLNKPTYDFVMNLSGFIAHYDIFGFIDNYHQNYQPIGYFFTELSNSYEIRRPERFIQDSFFSTGENSSYYKSKYDLLVRIKKEVLGEQ